MSEVLSQNEIDSLLAALDSGELEVDALKEKQGPQVKNYDFKRPAKFSKEHLRTLEIIFEHYGRLLSTNLPVYLRKNVQVGVASSEAVTFSEFTNALSIRLFWELSISNRFPAISFSRFSQALVMPLSTVCLEVPGFRWKETVIFRKLSCQF